MSDDNIAYGQNIAAGHRQRVKAKFANQDVSSFTNVEILEALLFFCHQRRDVKHEAIVLDKISGGSISKFLLLEEFHLKVANIKYVGNNVLFLNKVIKEIAARYFRDKIIEFTFGATKEIGEYLISRSGFISHEQLRVLYLNAKNRLIDDSVVSKGTVNETAIYIREIVSLALQKSAVSIVISHNHPSGDVTPSKEDIEITYNLRRALELMLINLQDHIIVSNNNYFSFKTEGLL